MLGQEELERGYDMREIQGIQLRQARSHGRGRLGAAPGMRAAGRHPAVIGSHISCSRVTHRLQQGHTSAATGSRIGCNRVTHRLQQVTHRGQPAARGSRARGLQRATIT
jgi:hypothetical protein